MLESNEESPKAQNSWFVRISYAESIANSRVIPFAVFIWDGLHGRLKLDFQLVSDWIDSSDQVLIEELLNSLKGRLEKSQGSLVELATLRDEMQNSIRISAAIPVSLQEALCFDLSLEKLLSSSV
jgi:hypothetical protein